MRYTYVAAVVVCAVVPVCAHAQRSHLVLLAGPTFSNLTGSYIQDSGGRETGVAFLGTIDREFGSFVFATGLGFAQKGGTRVALSGTTGETYGYVATYLEVPLIARVTFRFANGKFSLAPYTGFTVGLASTCKIKPGDQFGFDDECEESTPGGTLEKLEFAVPVGATFSLEFPGGSRFTVIDLKYQLGLTNAFTAADAAGQVARNGAFVAMLGFALPLY